MSSCDNCLYCGSPEMLIEQHCPIERKGEWVKKEDVIDLLKKWADGYCYLEIPIDDAIKGIENMRGGAE